MVKWAAEFESPSMPYSYQVQRAEFDEILFRNAARKGANTIEGCRVNDVTFLPNEEGVVARAIFDDGTEQTWRARFLLDASGRDTFLGTRLKMKLRVSGPTMRSMFMAPRNFLSTKRAVLSVLAGDVFGGSPIGPSLLVFKALYYITALLNLPRTISGWRTRKINIRDVKIDGLTS